METIACVHRRENRTQAFTSTLFNHAVDIMPPSLSVVLHQQPNQKVLCISSFCWARQQ